ncbi:hypothetical protein [Arthrobacter sp. C152]
MDTGTILGFSFGYLATIAGVFLLYLPIIAMVLVLLVVTGILELIVLPFSLLIHKLRRADRAPDMDRTWIPGGPAGRPAEMNRVRKQLGIALSVLLALGGAPGCSYDYPEPAHPSAAGLQAEASRPPYTDPLVLEREVGNYARLDRLLKAVPGRVLLFEEGPLDGPARGFGATAPVPAAGLYTVTAACVGAAGATVSVGQEQPGAPFRPEELPLDCAGTATRVMALQQGYVFAHLLLPAAGDTPWTGAVGGVRVTG